jgi:hypothetical protein
VSARRVVERGELAGVQGADRGGSHEFDEPELFVWSGGDAKQ